VDDVRAGRILRELRRRRGWSQAALGARCGMSQSTVSLVERGHLDTLALRTLRRAFAALDARFDPVISWRGGALDRLLDEEHAAMTESLLGDLGRWGWSPLVEVSFNHFGERGSIDVLALHAPSRCAAVFEVKSAITASEELHRRLDVEVRLAPALVEERFAVRPIAVGRIVVLPRTATTYRRLGALGMTFAAALPGSSPDTRRWLRDLTGASRASFSSQRAIPVVAEAVEARFRAAGRGFHRN
jgi:transcriptional regulator with XRE-family HTH domain